MKSGKSSAEATTMRTASITTHPRLIWPATIMLLLAACATGPNVIANQDPAADFSRYRTYNFDENFGTDKDGYESLMSQHFKTSIGREMETLGYRKSENPDLLVNVYVHTKEKIRSTQTPTTGGYYGYRGSRYGTWGGYGGSQTTVTQHTEGTINIDLIDKERGQLVWEAEVSGRVTDKVRENLQATIDLAVTEIFIKYPYTAGSSAVRAAQSTP
jgi:hypothetical protein